MLQTQPARPVHATTATLLDQLDRTEGAAGRARILYRLADLRETPAQLRAFYSTAAFTEYAADTSDVGIGRALSGEYGGGREFGPQNVLGMLSNCGVQLDAFERNLWTKLESETDRGARSEIYFNLGELARRSGSDEGEQIGWVLDRIGLSEHEVATPVTLSKIRRYSAFLFFLFAVSILVGAVTEGHIGEDLTAIYEWVTGLFNR